MGCFILLSWHISYWSLRLWSDWRSSYNKIYKAALVIFILFHFFSSKVLGRTWNNEIKIMTNHERQTMHALWDENYTCVDKKIMLSRLLKVFIKEAIITIRKIVIITLESHIITVFVSWRRRSLYKDIRKHSNS